jgi:hypothetical protein
MPDFEEVATILDEKLQNLDLSSSACSTEAAAR